MNAKEAYIKTKEIRHKIDNEDAVILKGIVDFLITKAVEIGEFRTYLNTQRNHFYNRIDTCKERQAIQNPTARYLVLNEMKDLGYKIQESTYTDNLCITISWEHP